MISNETPGRSFSYFTRFIVVVALLLIWWGAATTTKQAGMIFADWPLSMGTINPPGWLENMIPFLEHTHRLLAKAVGVLVLILFFWTYVRSGKKALEVAGLIVWLIVMMGFFHRRRSRAGRSGAQAIPSPGRLRARCRSCDLAGLELEKAWLDHSPKIVGTRLADGNDSGCSWRPARNRDF